MNSSIVPLCVRLKFKQYLESVEYDANSNITGLQRYGMLNDKTYGLIDDLSFVYNGNQRKRVADDADVRQTYSGAFDFVDGVSRITEYSYNACLIFHGAKIITFL